MSIIKKATSVGVSAALLASLVAVVAAPAALASTSVVSAGVVPVGGCSTTATSFFIQELAGGDWVSPGGTIIVTLTDSASADTIYFSGTPTLSAPGVLGASVAMGPTFAVGSSSNFNSFTVTLTGDDGVNALGFTVGGLKLCANATGVATGAINATTSGSILSSTYISSVTATATGRLSAATNVGVSSVVVINDVGACDFAATNTNTGGTLAGNLAIAADPTAESLGIAAVTATSNPAVSSDTQTLTLSSPTAYSHSIGDYVSQTGVPGCGATNALPSPGTVAASVTQNAVAGTVNPGEQNQVTGYTWITESAAGYLTASEVLTFTISSPTSGVTFSTSPTAWPSAQIDLGNGLGEPALCVLQYGGTSCQVTVKTASTTVASSIYLAGASSSTSGILLDEASTVAAGTPVNVTVSGSGLNVAITADTIANSSRVIVGFGATPTIYINYNAQPSGMITLTESVAGQFTSSTSGVDAFGVCITTGESFTYVPYALVTGGTGLTLLNPTTSGAVTSQVGTLFTDDAGQSCAMWTVFSPSTSPATISIVGATASGPLTPGADNGPTLSVPGTLTPGPTEMNVLVGTQTQIDPDGTGASTIVNNAVRAFKSGVVVTALSQPFIAPGTTGPAGSVTFTETLNGQLAAGEVITCSILPPVGGNAAEQAYLDTANSNALPIVTTGPSGSGLTAHLAGTTATSFSVAVDQQAYAPALGMITVSNINYTLVSGATSGPVQLSCAGGIGSANASGTIVETAQEEADYGYGLVQLTSTCSFVEPGSGSPAAGDYIVNGVDTGIDSYVDETLTGEQWLYFDYLPFTLTDGMTVTQTNVPGCNGGVSFQVFVSNAVSGMSTAEFLSADSATGVTNLGPFTISTKVTTKGSYVTVRIQSSPALAGKDFGIFIAKKVKGVWTKFSPHTGRFANGQGVVYYYYKAGSVAWLSIRGFFAGDASHGAAWSNAVQVQFTK